jgi:hypothetical protein
MKHALEIAHKPKDPTMDDSPDPHDPYRIRSIEQLLALFDGGAFLEDLNEKQAVLLTDLRAHLEDHGTKGCEGEMVLRIKYAPGKSGDVAMGAAVEFKGPKKPAASAAAYVAEDEDGKMTLFSPMLKRMQQPVRDVNYDPVTGEIRNPKGAR